MCSRIKLSVFAVLALVAGHGPAQAEDFIFDGPVDVRSLPDLINRIGVNCFVHRVDSRGSFGVQVGSGYDSFPLDRGTFTGRVRIPVSVSEGRSPSEAGGWSCLLSLHGAGGNQYNALTDSDPDSSSFVPALRRQPDAVIVNHVFGRF